MATTGLEGANAVVGKHEVDGEDLQHFKAPVGAGIAAGQPVAIGKVVGVTLEPADSAGLATIDTDRKRWQFDVKNVKTYNASTGAEATWAAVAFGDLVYIDPETRTLSLSPLDASGNSNVVFGTVVDTALSGTATQVTETNVDILVADYR